MGPSTVLVTSVLRPDAPEDTVEMLAVHGDAAWIVQTPRLPLKANGSGDVTAALFTAHLLATGDPKAALERTASSVFDLLATTLDSGRRELAAGAVAGGDRPPAARSSPPCPPEDPVRRVPALRERVVVVLRLPGGPRWSVIAFVSARRGPQTRAGSGASHAAPLQA